MRKSFLCLWMLLCLCAGCSREPASPSPSPVAAEQTFFELGNRTVPQLAKELSPSVVGLAVTVNRDGQSVQGLGTGFFVDKEGYILTNHHVAGEAADIQVLLADGGQLTAKRVWSDATLDLAVLRCPEGGSYPAVELGEMAGVEVGQTVVAVGTPLDLAFQQTVTCGIVSGLNRTLQVSGQGGFLEELIQTDASINPGNSGGPLATLDGKVIGINTVKVVDAEGLGFAIPAELAAPIVEHVVKEGGFVAPYVGLTVLDQDLARYYGQEVGDGLTVLGVDESGPAAKAGIRAGDVLLKAENRTLTTVLSFRKSLYAHLPGDAVTLFWQRNGKTMQASVILAVKQ